MIAYKGFTKNLTATLGRGTYQFQIGKPVKEESSKTTSCGFHCCENPFECLRYYSWENGNRFFQVEAGGSIDEDGTERIACTEMTLVKELTELEFAGYGMMYILQHPLREKWQQHNLDVIVSQEAIDSSKNRIVISRGPEPMVKAYEGQIIGLIKETEPGVIMGAKLFTASKEHHEKWYTVVINKVLVEVQNEKEDN